MGALIGAAVGDALGAPLEFLTPRIDKEDWETEMCGGGVLKWQPGDITDDTIMSLAVSEMYLEAGGYNQRTLVEKWVHWQKSGPKDIGNWTNAVLSKWNGYLRATEDVKIDVMGIEHPAIKLWIDAGKRDAGNGGLMRCMPTALWEPMLTDRIEQTTRICMDSHPDVRCIETCILEVEMLHEMIERSMDKKEAMFFMHKLVKDFIKNDEIIDSIKGIENKKWGDTNNGGYTVDSIESALSGFYLSENFEDGLVAVVNKGNDADTVGAIAGALMGAFYGYKAIPDRWLDALVNTDQLLDISEKLFTRRLKVQKESVQEMP